MWTNELIFEHLDNGLQQGTVIETLLFEYCRKDFDDYTDKISEIISYEMWLTGMSFETAIREGEDFHVYLSDKDDDEIIHCYCVKYGVETTQIFEVKPSTGELRK